MVCTAFAVLFGIRAYMFGQKADLSPPSPDWASPRC